MCPQLGEITHTLITQISISSPDPLLTSNLCVVYSAAYHWRSSCLLTAHRQLKLNMSKTADSFKSWFSCVTSLTICLLSKARNLDSSLPPQPHSKSCWFYLLNIDQFSLLVPISALDLPLALIQLVQLSPNCSSCSLVYLKEPSSKANQTTSFY